MIKYYKEEEEEKKINKDGNVKNIYCTSTSLSSTIYNLRKETLISLAGGYSTIRIIKLQAQVKSTLFFFSFVSTQKFSLLFPSRGN